MTIGRILGSVSGVAAAALWALMTYWNPYVGDADDSQTLSGMLLIGASLVAAAAGAAGAHLAMYILFFVLFVPIGFYVMLSGGVVSLIGGCNLLYLASAILVHRSVARTRPGPAPSH